MKGISLLITLVFLFSLGAGVLAQDIEFTLPKAGITPDSPFYFLDRLGEFLQEFFTFSPEGKAHLQITFAAERIAEIKVVLEVKGVEAPGLDVAQSRLQAHLAKAATIITNQKAKRQDVASLAQELDDEFEGPKSALAQTFKEQKRALEAQEKELKVQLRAAHRAGDVVREEAIAAQLGQVKGQLELLELREEDLEKELEAEEERIEEEMGAQQEAKKAIKEAEEELQEIKSEAEEKGLVIPSEALTTFNSLISEATAALNAENYKEAKRLAEQAEDALENIEETIEELEEAQEKEEEGKEKLEEQQKEEEEQEQEQEENETANWKTYTYKRTSFQYPKDWTVVFDSEVFGQPNGFDLHVEKTGDGGYQPDGLYLSTYNNRSGTDSDYIPTVNRVFAQNQSGDSYIQFVVNGTTIYAGCAYYSKGQSTIDVCNRIVSTVMVK